MTSRLPSLAVLAISAYLSSGISTATQLSNSAGLTTLGITPANTQTFENPVLPFNTVVGTNFTGVSSTTLFYDGNNGGGNPNCAFYQESGNCVTNFQSSGTSGTNFQTTFSIFFNVPQTYAAFAMITGGAATDTFTAFNGSQIVDSFTATTNSIYNVNAVPLPGVGNYFGFSESASSLFNQIQVVITSGNQAALIDNVQFSTAPPRVPEPSTVALFGLGLTGLGLLARKRRSV